MTNMFPKYFVLFAVLLFLFACDKPILTQYYNKYQGTYKFVSACTNIPVDLNFDGIKSTNVQEEMTVCGSYYDYNLTMSAWGGEKNDYAKVYYLDMVTSRNGEQGWADGCYGASQLQIKLTITKNSENVFEFLSQEDNEEASYYRFRVAKTKLIYWHNDTLFCNFTKEFYTPDGWQEVNLYTKYLKVSDGFSYIEQ